MKKKMIAAVLGMVLAFALTACGGKKEAAETNAEPAQETVTQEAPAEEPAAEEPAAEEPAVEEETGDFTLLDVTTDMIGQGLYAVDEAGNELVVTLFTAPDQTPMISMFIFDAEGNGDVICGAYGEDNLTIETDEDNITWTTFNIVDAYTESDMTIICAEGEDGSAYITNQTGDVVYEAQYLTADETINYMGVAVSLLTDEN